MSHTVPALATTSAGAPFERTTIERRELGEHDVRIDIAYAGICHSDIHQAREEWGASIFPMVPGHEIAGIVSAVGSAVTRHAVGDRVGVGCFVDSCRDCDACRAGEEQFCEQGNVPTYNGRYYEDGAPTYGGYSTQTVVDEHYVLSIPEGIALDVAAPLLCAGITTYSPLRHWSAGPGKQVAIVGMGGLGHLGVKIAHALGAEVTVISHTLSKKDDGVRFGATHYETGDRETLKRLRGRFDLIVNTVSADLPVDAYLRTLKLDGTMVFVGAPENKQSFRVFSLIGGRRRLAGSNIGGIRETQEMLDFCAAHGIGAEIETITADDVDKAYDRVVESDVRYRFVIDTATIPG